MKRLDRRVGAVAAAAAVVLPIACASVPPPAHSQPREPLPLETRDASLFAQPWRWTDELGNAVTLSIWRGQTVVLSAIYTRCKSTCPRTVAKMRHVYEEYVHDGRPAQFLLLTLDPTTDTPASLRAYKNAAALPSSWHLLTGSPRDTEELSDLLNVHVLDDGPHVMHDGKIVVFDERGVPRRRFGGWALDEEKNPRR